MDITIYKLTNTLNGMGYVGATKNFKRRMGEHHWNYGDKRKIRTIVDKAIREYGWENFRVEVIEICDAEVAPERESHWIKELNTLEPNGYNYTTGGNKGTKHTAESKMRMSFVEIEQTVFPVLQAELDKQQITRIAFARKLGVDMPLEELFAKSPA